MVSYLCWLSRNFTWKHTNHHFNISTKAVKNSWGPFLLLLVVSQAEAGHRTMDMDMHSSISSTKLDLVPSCGTPCCTDAPPALPLPNTNRRTRSCDGARSGCVCMQPAPRQHGHSFWHRLHGKSSSVVWWPCPPRRRPRKIRPEKPGALPVHHKATVLVNLTRGTRWWRRFHFLH